MSVSTAPSLSPHSRIRFLLYYWMGRQVGAWGGRLYYTFSPIFLSSEDQRAFRFHFCVCLGTQSHPTPCNLTDCNITHQAPLTMGFPRKEYWIGEAISFQNGQQWEKKKKTEIKKTGWQRLIVLFCRTGQRGLLIKEAGEEKVSGSHASR